MNNEPISHLPASSNKAIKPSWLEGEPPLISVCVLHPEEEPAWFSTHGALSSPWQALAQAIREAREQHPDMSVTRVVVHKETELEEGEE